MENTIPRCFFYHKLLEEHSLSTVDWEITSISLYIYSSVFSLFNPRESHIDSHVPVLVDPRGSLNTFLMC